MSEPEHDMPVAFNPQTFGGDMLHRLPWESFSIECSPPAPMPLVEFTDASVRPHTNEGSGCGIFHAPEDDSFQLPEVGLDLEPIDYGRVPAHHDYMDEPVAEGQVRVPEGLEVGETFLALTPDGQLVEIAVPEGAQPEGLVAFGYMPRVY